jgi:hypothetical protein
VQNQGTQPTSQKVARGKPSTHNGYSSARVLWVAGRTTRQQQALPEKLKKQGRNGSRERYVTCTKAAVAATIPMTSRCGGLEPDLAPSEAAPFTAAQSALSPLLYVHLAWSWGTFPRIHASELCHDIISGDSIHGPT